MPMYNVLSNCKLNLIHSSFVQLYSQEFAVDVESLPSALEDVKPPIFCEHCEKAGKLKMTASTYCVRCDRKFCAADQQVGII